MPYQSKAPPNSYYCERGSKTTKSIPAECSIAHEEFELNSHRSCDEHAKFSATGPSCRSRLCLKIHLENPKLIAASEISPLTIFT